MANTPLLSTMAALFSRSSRIVHGGKRTETSALAQRFEIGNSAKGRCFLGECDRARHAALGGWLNMLQMMRRMRLIAGLAALELTLTVSSPAYAIQDNDKILRGWVNDGHAAFDRGDYARAVANWRQAYDSLAPVKATRAKRQMLLELLLRAYYELDTRAADLVRVRSVLQLVDHYRSGLDAKDSESETIRDWYVTFQERAGRLEAEAQTKVLLATNTEMSNRLKQQANAPKQNSAAPNTASSKPTQAEADLIATPCPKPSPVPARAALISGVSLLTLGLGGAALLTGGILQSRKYDNDASVNNLEKGYRANGLAYAGGISMVMLIPGAILLGVGIKHRNVQASVAVLPRGFVAQARF